MATEPQAIYLTCVLSLWPPLAALEVAGARA